MIDAKLAGEPEEMPQIYYSRLALIKEFLEAHYGGLEPALLEKLADDWYEELYGESDEELLSEESDEESVEESSEEDEETAEKAVKYYRERYSATGIFENSPYPGVESMLSELKAKGYRLAVASSKPEYFVAQILDYFQLTDYFEEIVGSEMNGNRTSKSEVIEEALRRLGMSEKRNQVIMVGDKEHDVFGARKADLKCVAVSYGYGSQEELEQAEPLKIVDSTEGVLDFFA